MAHLISEERAKRVLTACRTRQLLIATVESCTGGLIASALTDISGSSDVVECGFVTYSNRAKTMLVGVPANLIEHYGAVSKEVALAMSEGALSHSYADIAVAVTGIAGPEGGSIDKPVGLVHIAAACRNKTTLHIEARFGSLERDQIRHGTVNRALDLVLTGIEKSWLE